MRPTEIVELDGVQAYVTYEDADGYMRVTPIVGDPMVSIQTSRDSVTHVGYKDNTDG